MKKAQLHEHALLWGERRECSSNFLGLLRCHDILLNMFKPWKLRVNGIQIGDLGGSPRSAGMAPGIN
jgi:hypothetical protein